MLLKLIKYEWKAMIRAMLPVYAATLIISAVNGILISEDLFSRINMMLRGTIFESLFAIFQVLLIVVYAGLLIGLVIMTFLVTVQRFYKGLLRDEGYLMFTLPVKVSQLTLSRAIVSVLIGMISFIVGFFAIGLLMGTDFFRALWMLPGEFANALRRGFLELGNGLMMHMGFYALELLIMFIAGSFESVYGFYSAMALGQLSRDHKILFSVIWYILLSIAETMLVWALILAMTGPAAFVFSMKLLTDPVTSMHIFLICMDLLILALLLIRAAITNIILQKKLNLE